MSIFDQPETERLLGNMIQPVTVFDPNPGHSSRAAREDHRHQLDPNILAGVGQGRQNLLDNGGFLIAQRTLPVTGIGYGFDRWSFSSVGGGLVSHNASSLVPTNDFIGSAVYTVTTVDASIAAGEYSFLQQGVEGYTIASLGYGSLNAKTTVLSFWTRSSVGGTYSVSLRNASGTRSYVFEFLLEANTWKKIVVNIPGCTDGTWPTTNVLGAIISIALSTGSTFQTTPNTWAVGNFIGTANQVNFTGTLSNTFNLVGVKWEVGSLVTNFTYEDISLETQRAYRYFQKSASLANAFAVNYLAALAASYSSITPYLFPMRVTPTARWGRAALGDNNVFAINGAGAVVDPLAATVQPLSPTHYRVFCAGDYRYLDSTAGLEFSSEI